MVDRPHQKKRKAVQAGGSRLLLLLPRLWEQQFCRIHNHDNNEIVDSFIPGGKVCVISAGILLFQFQEVRVGTRSDFVPIFFVTYASV
jgi:hypothetical protein